MPSILINGKYCKIVGETDQVFIKGLDKMFSFFVEGAQYSKIYKGFYDATGNWVRWDGRKHLMNSQLVFPIGLLPRAEQFYKDWEKDYKVVDLRKKRIPNQPIDISQKLKELNLDPRDYQLEVLEAVKNVDRGIIRAATGSGKTLMIAMIAAWFNKKTAVYVIGKDLLYQFYNLFVSIFGKDKVGIVGDGHCEIKDFNIVSVWTAGVALGLKKNAILLDNDDSEEIAITKYEEVRNLIKNVKIQMLDECHAVVCDTIQKIYKQSQAEATFGFSGTPWREDGQDLMIEGMLGKYLVNIPASILIEKGVLAKPKIRFVNVPPNPEVVGKNYKSIYSQYVVENDMRNNLILEYAKKLTDKNYQTLVLFNNIKHGELLYELISPHISCALLSGKDDAETRDEVKQKLLNKEINLVIASRIFDIGIDVPSLSALILGSAGKSSIRTLQRVGRIIRKYPGKQFVYVIDFADNCQYLRNHSKIRYKTYCSESGFEVSWPQKK